ncbi:MAG: hypothetical protein AB7O96_15405 [Pseudobdellovibrionaceae bacterium]
MDGSTLRTTKKTRSQQIAGTTEPEPEPKPKPDHRLYTLFSTENVLPKEAGMPRSAPQAFLEFLLNLGIVRLSNDSPVVEKTPVFKLD